MGCGSGQPTAPVKCALWSVTGLGAGQVIPGSTVTSGTLTPGQWNYIPLAAPVPLAIGAPYIAAIGLNGAFPVTPHSFGSGDPYAAGIASGPLAACPTPPGHGRRRTATGRAASPPPDPIRRSPSPPPAALITTGPMCSIRRRPGRLQLPGIVAAVAEHVGRPRGGVGLPGQLRVATEVHLSTVLQPGQDLVLLQPGTRRSWRPSAACGVISSQTLAAENTSPTWSGAAGSGWVSCFLHRRHAPGGCCTGWRSTTASRSRTPGRRSC